LFQSGNYLFRKIQMELGIIDGESVQYPEFQKKAEELGEIYKSNTNSNNSQLDEQTWTQIREQTWQELVREKVMSKVYKEIGLDVSSEDLFDLLQGNNPHAIIQQIFTNPETGQFERSAVINFLKNLETGVRPEQKSYWLYLEKQIQSERLLSKYNSLLEKSMYVTGQEAQQSLEARNKNVDIEFFGLDYNTIPDSSVKVTETELNDYYNLHKEDYKGEKTRSIEYVTFEVKPSPADFASSKKWIDEIKTDFTNATDNIQFVNSNSDVSFNDTWYKMTALPDSLSAWVNGGAVVGDVYGPYFENDTYKLAKVHAIEMLPDSVQARHILLKVTSSEEVAAKQALADSLKNVIDKGGDFASLARQYSTDSGSAINGGDLGWFSRGMMVKPFEEAAFANKVNEVRITPSQFGIHIIQTTRRGNLNKHAQVAVLERIVTPSTQTFQAAYSKAGKFTSENTSADEFNAAVENEKLVKRTAVVRESDPAFAEFENSRPLIRAAFKESKKVILKNTDGSPIFEMGDNFVVATLVGATEEGTMSFESVRNRVELAVRKEKKAAMLVEKINGVAQGKTDLHAIAEALGTKVNEASSLNFGGITLPDHGNEPAVIGAAVSLEPNALSQPVKGNNGVYLLKATSVTNTGDTNVDSEKQRLNQTYKYRVSMQAFNVHQDAVKIEDKRSKFY